MENVTFDTLNAAWNQFRQYDGWTLRSQVSGLRDPSQIIMQRSGETPDTLTITFTGFDQALDNPERDAPLMKSFIRRWVQRKFSVPAQIARGDASTFILVIHKPVSTPPVPTQEAVEPDITRSLVYISKVRKVHGH